MLAAGLGTRFGHTPKLLAELNGKPLLEYAVDAQCAVSELRQVVVVLGAHAQQIRESVRFGRAKVVICESWDQGQSESLRCGVRALRAATAVIITLGDMPLIEPSVIRATLRRQPPARAAYAGQPGHPVLLGPQELAALSRLQGDVGARALLAGVQPFEAENPAAVTDIDSPADLEAVRRKLATSAAATATGRLEA